MRLAVLGAAGRTGTATVRAAQGRGHAVVAIARRRLDDLPAGVKPAVADVTDANALLAALAGTDAVISTVGIGSARDATTVYSTGVRTALTAMAAAGAHRLVVVSASPAGPRGDHPALQRALILPILERIFGASYRDMRRMERILTDADAAGHISWVAVRPPRLLDKTARGSYRTGITAGQVGGAITIADLADALVDFAEAGEPTGGVYVSN